MFEVIRKVIEYEIAQGQAAYEMLADGYAGDIEAYIADYMHDYEVEEIGAGIYSVYNMTGQSWIVEDGSVEEVIF